jgi:hypothetical protein
VIFRVELLIYLGVSAIHQPFINHLPFWSRLSGTSKELMLLFGLTARDVRLFGTPSFKRCLVGAFQQNVWFQDTLW